MSRMFGMECTLEGIQMQIHIACSLLNTNDLWNNPSSHISSISKISICVVQAKKELEIGTQLSLRREMWVRVTIFHLLYISNGSRKKPDCSALDGVHVSECRLLATTQKQQEQEEERCPKHAHHFTHAYTFPTQKGALLQSLFLLGEVCKAVV